MTDETQVYIVTEQAPRRVATRRVKPGDTMTLTERAARTDLRMGHIVPKDGGDPKEPFKTTGKLKDIQARARGFDDAASEKAAAEKAKQASETAKAASVATKAAAPDEPDGGKAKGDGKAK